MCPENYSLEIAKCRVGRLSVYFFFTRIIFPSFALRRHTLPDMNMVNRNDFFLMDNVCRRIYEDGGPFFMVTTEDLPWLLFQTDREFMEGTNIIAIALSGTGVRLLVDVQMNNHIHLLVEGKEENAKLFVYRLRKRMVAFARRKDRSLTAWKIQVKRIVDIDNLRNAILYIARNPYVAMRNTTPLGYRWGSAHLLFNQNLADYATGVPYKDLIQKEKRAICHSHETDLSDRYMVNDGMILRTSFVDYRRAEEFFISANQFFQWLSRRKESDIETARWIGESILLPNDDVFRIVSDWYGVRSLRTLNVETRLEAARRMRHDLSSNNKQISQVLQIPLSQINALFPVPK